MGARRTATRALTAVAVSAAGLTWGASPAHAHGAMQYPVSRQLACSADVAATAQSPVCQAALAAAGPDEFAGFDNLRVANVNGMDSQVIPNGQLCGGGIPTYQGLNLARTDWPTTTLTAGAPITMNFLATIPHEGNFRMYVTKAGYDPTQPLTWAQLESTPFMTADHPPVVNGTYQMSGTLPAGRTGRAMIYTVWQNDYVDTYYSCSDVNFTPAGLYSGAVDARQPVAAPHRTGPTAAAAHDHGTAPTRSGSGTSPLTTALLAGAGMLTLLGAARLRRRRG